MVNDTISSVVLKNKTQDIENVIDFCRFRVYIRERKRVNKFMEGYGCLDLIKISGGVYTLMGLEH